MSVLGTIYLLNRMSAGRELVDLHLIDTANGLAAFGWHIDNHAEMDEGRRKKYIERSVACQCSQGLTSMTVAGLPERSCTRALAALSPSRLGRCTARP